MNELLYCDLKKKDIINLEKPDEIIIKNLKRLSLLDNNNCKLKEANYENEEYCILHLAAKHCRNQLCYFLIEELNFSKYCLSFI